MKHLASGDRLWVWLAEETSTFEAYLADELSVFPISENAENNNGVFHVRVFSWRGNPAFTQEFLKIYLPLTVELPFDRMIKFVKIDHRTEFSIPIATLSLPEEGWFLKRGKKLSAQDRGTMRLSQTRL